jgi:hypothetical protein
MPPHRIVKILEHISNDNGLYIKKLGELLDHIEKKRDVKKCEERESDKTNKTSDEEIDVTSKQWIDENLSLIFTIFRNLFFIASQDIIELLLNDELYLITFGALEHDLESQKTIKHRSFFKEQSQFKNIINITDPDMLSKIHLNHRLAYLRDTAIGRFIEENTIKHINILMHCNNNDIITYFLKNKQLLKAVIERVNEDDMVRKDEGILFLLEMIKCCKDFVIIKLEL